MAVVLFMCSGDSDWRCGSQGRGNSPGTLQSQRGSLWSCDGVVGSIRLADGRRRKLTPVLFCTDTIVGSASLQTIVSLTGLTFGSLAMVPNCLEEDKNGILEETQRVQKCLNVEC